MTAANPSFSPSLLLSKSLRRHSKWEKDEILTLLYFLRQIFGAALGLVCGILPLLGFIGILSFLVVNVGLVYFYYQYFLQIEDDDILNGGGLVQEGLFPSFSLFLITWIFFYNSLHV